MLTLHRRSIQNFNQPFPGSPLSLNVNVSVSEIMTRLVVQFGDHFWSGDYLLSNLGSFLIQGSFNDGTRSFAGLYRAFQSG